MKKINSKGFTLIELMIVVAIIGILAAIAIPNFIRYQLRSKTTEAKVVMGGIKTSQESFRAEYDNYAPIAVTPGTQPGTTKANWGGATCATACTRQSSQLCSQFACIGYSPSGQVYYQYQTARTAAGAGTPAELSIGARADLDGDTVNGSFTYRTANSTGRTTQTLNDNLSTCATASIPAGEVYDCNPNVY